MIGYTASTQSLGGKLVTVGVRLDGALDGDSEGSKLSQLPLGAQGSYKNKHMNKCECWKVSTHQQ